MTFLISGISLVVFQILFVIFQIDLYQNLFAKTTDFVSFLLYSGSFVAYFSLGILGILLILLWIRHKKLYATYTTKVTNKFFIVLTCVFITFLLAHTIYCIFFIIKYWMLNYIVQLFCGINLIIFFSCSLLNKKTYSLYIVLLMIGLSYLLNTLGYFWEYLIGLFKHEEGITYVFAQLLPLFLISIGYLLILIMLTNKKTQYKTICITNIVVFVLTMYSAFLVNLIIVNRFYISYTMIVLPVCSFFAIHLSTPSKLTLHTTIYK